MRAHRAVLIAAALTALIVAAGGSAASAAPSPAASRPHLLAAGLQGSVGSTIGPDGALYIAEGITGTISRIDPKTGRRTIFASGLPRRVIGLGGAMDVAFLHHTAYVLVTLVGPDVGGTSTVGVYRVDGPHLFTVIADIGAFSIAHPPATDFFIPTGLQYALQPYRGGFLVTDGHHNRVLDVAVDGHISEFRTFGDIVPTGLALRGRTVLLAQAGPVPHLPQDGRVVALRPPSDAVRDVAAGAPLLVDVETGPDHSVYALSQGHFTPGGEAGSAADPGTGALERVTPQGTLVPVATALDQPTSVEIVGATAYVVTLTGQVWTVRLRH